MPAGEPYGLMRIEGESLDTAYLAVIAPSEERPRGWFLFLHALKVTRLAHPGLIAHFTLAEGAF